MAAPGAFGVWVQITPYRAGSGPASSWRADRTWPPSYPSAYETELVIVSVYVLATALDGRMTRTVGFHDAELSPFALVAVTTPCGVADDAPARPGVKSRPRRGAFPHRCGNLPAEPDMKPSPLAHPGTPAASSRRPPWLVNRFSDIRSWSNYVL